MLFRSDLLSAVAANEPNNAKARSDLSIASFPTAADFVNGFEIQTKDWLSIADESRDQLSAAMQFARKPTGLTPYGAAMTAGNELFSKAASDGRAKVAVLVTDGEPTDQNPNGVVAKAQALSQAGVQVITVFIAGDQARQSREATHTAMLKKIDTSSVENGNGHWYDSAYADFSSYMQALLGSSTQKSLVSTISNQVVEVQDSAALKAAFLKIIKTQAISCAQ